MNIQVNSTHSFQVNYPSEFRTYVEKTSPSDETRSGSATNAAFVYGVDPVSAAQSLTEADAQLSDEELKQLFTVYKNLGPNDDLWKDIGRLLTQFSGNDRANFLSVISRSGDNIKGVVTQLSRLDSSNQSAYLRIAVRLDPKEGLKDLIHSIKHLDKDTVTSFLDVADSLGRSRKSLKAGELKHFISAAAGSPEAIEALIQKTSEIDKEDRALFLKAAAVSGKELERLITTIDTLPEKDLSVFLTAASKAGKGLSNLLDLTSSLDSGARKQMMAFIKTLSEQDTENFLKATLGVEAIGNRLMEAASDMSRTERHQFFTIAANAENNLDRFITMVNAMSLETGDRSNFLAMAVTGEDRLNDVLSFAESLQREDRAAVLSFTSDLNLVDLSSFLTASINNDSEAKMLANAADGLEGKNRSYLLYAAAVSPGNISDLADLTSTLEGGDLDNFLFTAANTSDQDGMEQLLVKTSQMSGRERSKFLNQQRHSLLEDGEVPLAREYVFLKSAFSGRRFDTLINAGPDGIDRFITEAGAMDKNQRKAFLDLADAAGKEGINSLLAVTTGLDEERLSSFMALSRSLNQEGKKDLINAADLALNKFGGNSNTFDRLLSTAKNLSVEFRRHFLNAAAASGTSLGKFMNLTNQLGEANKTNFLIAANLNADVDDGGRLLKSFVQATDYLFNDILGNILELKDRPGGIRPSQIINIQNGIFNHNAKPNTVNMSFYLSSAAFIAAQKDAAYGLRMDWYNSFMNIPAQDH